MINVNDGRNHDSGQLAADVLDSHAILQRTVVERSVERKRESEDSDGPCIDVPSESIVRRYAHAVFFASVPRSPFSSQRSMSATLLKLHYTVSIKAE